MPEHCDKCGTELHEDQHRHQQFRFEPVTESNGTMEGRLCADCAIDFEAWLDEK